MINKTAKPINLLLAICSLLLITCSLFLTACPEPFAPYLEEAKTPDNIPAGKGAFYLNIDDVEYRTILPSNNLDQFVKYTLVFLVGNTTTIADTVNRTNADIDVPVLLSPGSYKLIINAYTDELDTDPAATGESSFTIIESQTTPVSVILAAIKNDGNGSFSWQIIIPRGLVLSESKLEIQSLTGSTEGNYPLSFFDSVHEGVDVQIAISSCNLNAGQYRVILTLKKYDNSKNAGSPKFLQVYRNMESVMVEVLTADHFMELDEVGTPGLKFNEIGSPPIAYSVEMGDANAAEIVIPARYKGLPVTQIADNGFNAYDENNDPTKALDITSITIPNTVTTIGKYAFSYCSSLVSVNIPDSVEVMGEYAFGSCKNLTSITIPDKVTVISDYLFYECEKLENITIPDSVISIGYGAFNSCFKFTDIKIPDSVVIMGDFVFYRCENLTDIDIGDGVTSIGYGTFVNCNKLTNVKIGNGVKIIGNSAFNNCSSLVNLTFGNSVETIGNSAFNYCTSLTSITIPDSVTSIGDSAFRNCTGITNLTIGNSVETIGDSAFNLCTGITSLTIPDNVTNIGMGVFSSCSKLANVTIGSGIKIISHNTFANCNSLINITIPGTVEIINYAAFESCKGLTSVIIGNGVTTINGYAFSGCTNLTNINIPNSVTTIGDQVFKDCTYITSITIPNSVTYFGSGVFQNCSNLTSINIPNGITEIPYNMFNGCTSLTNVTIPANITSIGANAFADCTSLVSVEFKSTIAKADFPVGFIEDDIYYDFIYYNPFPGDLRDKYFVTGSAGGVGTYTRTSGSSNTWTKVVGTVGGITISFAPELLIPEVENDLGGAVIHKNSSSGPTQITFTIDTNNSNTYDNARWYYGYPPAIIGTGNSVKLDAKDYAAGDKYITLIVEVNDVPYSVLISFTVVE